MTVFNIDLNKFSPSFDHSKERYPGLLTIVVAPPIFSLKHYIPVGKPNSRNDFKLEIKYKYKYKKYY
mgnify:CR=1 FL=1